MMKPDRLRRLLDETGLTQAELARRANLSQSYISLLCRRGADDPTLIARLAGALGRAAAELEGVAPEPKATEPGRPPASEVPKQRKPAWRDRMDGDRLRSFIEASGLQQASIARAAGLSRQTVTKILQRGSSSTVAIEGLARALKISPAELLAPPGTPSEPAIAEPEVPPSSGATPAAVSASPRLNGDERQLLDCFNALALADRAAVLHIAMRLAGQLRRPGESATTEVSA